MPKSQKKLLILKVENITHMEKQLNITPGAECGSAFAADGIRNIVFDLGGVVIDLCRENAVAALQSLGLDEADELLGLYRQEEPFLGLETGRITAGEFFETIRRSCPGASDIQITEAFNAFLADLPVRRLERLRELRRKGYRVYALSNTNPVMFHSWISAAFRQEGMQVNDYFDGIVASFEELCCKPDTAIFRTVLRRYDLVPAQTLMLDDSEKNCQAARDCGMMAIRVGRTKDDDMIAITENLPETAK